MSIGEATNEDVHRSLDLILRELGALPDDSRRRVIATVLTFYGHTDQSPHSAGPTPVKSPNIQTSFISDDGFSEDRSISPKEFLLEKRPQTDIERVACLAYYLTHYRATPFFKTLELSKLNTEAAQIKFSNAAYAVENATKRGFLTTAAQGNKQLTSMGEQFVRHLPDRTAARDAMSQLARRRRARRSKVEVKPK